jgi:ribosome-binding factor A
MASIRQEKVASLIKRDVGEIMQQNGTRYLPGKMITVTIVRMSPDLSFR